MFTDQSTEKSTTGQPAKARLLSPKDGRHVEPNRCWAEISLAQLKDNLKIVRRHVGPERKVMTVVKADAYGHGAVPVARALEEAGVDGLGVCCVDEAVELRTGGVKAPVLVLTGFVPGEETELIERGITPGITDIAQVEILEQAARAARRSVACQVKIDTGMGRLGVPAAEVPRLLDALEASPSLELEGLFTHFASSEDFTSPQTGRQVERFEKVRKQFAERGFDPPLIHMANTGATLARPESWGTMVRPGSLVYGFQSFLEFPNGEDRSEEFRAKVPVRPVMTLKARVFQVKDYPASVPVGYSARFVTERPSRLAILPIGYGDGWRRGLTGKCRAIVRGQYVPAVGTIAMDLTVVDVTDVPEARAGDEAILLGSGGEVAISPSEVARSLGTVASEILTGIGKRVPRYYIE